MVIVIFTAEILNMKELYIPVVIFAILVFHAIYYSIKNSFDKNKMLFLNRGGSDIIAILIIIK